MTADLRTQLERYTTAVVDHQPPITAAEVQAKVGVIRKLPEAPHRRAKPLPRRVAIAAAAAAVILAIVGAVAWLFGGTDADVVDKPAPAPVTTLEPTTSNTMTFTDSVWSLEATYESWLFPVAFDGGFAALSRSEWFGGGDLWLSTDGVHWGAAWTELADVPHSLSSDGNTLFAETVGSSAGTITVWASTSGIRWKPVLTPEDYRYLFEVDYQGASVVAAGGPGVVVFGVDHDGLVAGWVYDGERFVPADVGTIATLPPDSTEIKVAVLDNRFLLYNYDGRAGTTLDRYMTVSFSDSGTTWSDLTLPAPDSPLTLPDSGLVTVASANGLNLVSLNWGYGLWRTENGSAWDEIKLSPADTNGIPRVLNWLPHVTAGELGWIVFSPPDQVWIDAERNTAHSSNMERNRGLWYSADARSWVEFDDLGPLETLPPFGEPPSGEVETLETALIVRDHDILVFALVGERRGMREVDNPHTEIWRLVLDK